MSTEAINDQILAKPSDWSLAERYLEHVRVHRRLANRTVELYAADLEKLSEFAVALNLNFCQLLGAHMRQFVSRMHSAGRSARGIALILSGWRGFYAWLGREGLVLINPLSDLKAPKAPKPLPKALSADEAEQLSNFSFNQERSKVASHASDSDATHLQADDKDVWAQARLQAMLELLYGCGLRMAELTGLDVSGSANALGWIDCVDASAHVLGKGSKRRSIPVGRKALTALHHWLSVRALGIPATDLEGSQPKNAALFINRKGDRLSAQYVRVLLKKHANIAGLNVPVHPHMLRHSYASHLLQSSGDIRAVQELLGHVNISTTQIYTRLDFQHLASVYDAAHPRAHLKK
jgi:integrase/recombinase XerC